MAAVIIALVAGVFAGALVVWLVMRGQGQGSPVVMQSQGEIKARLDEALVHVQRLGAIFANAGQRVLIATPTTLVALLWSVAFGWQQDARFRQAQQIGDTAAELHHRFGVMLQHLHKTGRSLNTAIKTYNDLVGSLESRILPQLRKLEDLGILAPGIHLPDPQTIEAQTRPVPYAAGPASDSADGQAPTVAPRRAR